MNASTGVAETVVSRYVHTVLSYLGNERALTYECTTETTAPGTELHKFLHTLATRKITHAADKFTERKDGQLRFEKTAENARGGAEGAEGRPRRAPRRPRRRSRRWTPRRGPSF